MTHYCVNFPDVDKEASLLNQGAVQKIHIDAGLSMRVWNLNFSQAVTLSKSPEPIHSQFYLLFILTPASISLQTIEQHLQYNNNRERHSLLIPDNVSVQFNVKPHQAVQIIEFNIAVWRLKELTIDLFTQFLSDPDYKTVYIETGSWQMNTQATDLFQQTHTGAPEPTEILPKAGAFITSIIEKTFASHNTDTARVRGVYHGKMEEAEKILMEHLRDTLPNLSQIARQLAISESTLKRHFKLVYGKSIYGYYLARKMELARQLMDESHSTVSEMAEILGYEKVSYFIEIFKKYHGFCPGAIIRKRRTA